ncbi:MerR family DNA-binding transcriptional regulator [Glycomyces sp. TRM65418]|uniref:MerR family transcriptional regulator n=1 Tax=Glycomyces sp. TRM65418 TaxID=2867006 RepID=UPI001CE4C9D8|nr:MerR family DNA-binding transcriptional regulator [Glycomyces sp. TRM65418]MCC3764816.1 MerR family DNA-binding transcriptional regulator [Glycomyces sp. TRM65418]QZD54467.1 MerR family DNA-binding transcriptional regulator [Glycomyces sp. TRM65418]
MMQLRPSDLAREHGLSTQAVRNYERDGCLPPAERTRSGYRVYTEVHAAALRAFLALVRAYGHATAVEVMHAVHDDDLDAALMIIDRGHEQLLRDRSTLESVRAAVDRLTAETAPGRADGTGPVPDRTDSRARRAGGFTASRADLRAGRASEAGADPARAESRSSRGASEASGRSAQWAPFSIGELAHRLNVTPATLRNWEDAGVLAPERDRAGYRRFDAGDVRDAELAHLLRRGGYPLEHIATVVRQVRGAGGTAALSQALEDWRRRLTRQGLAMLDAAAALSRYLHASETGSPRDR